MAEYIEREVAIEDVDSLTDSMSVSTSIDMCLGMKSMKSRALSALNDIPAADVAEVRHAYWRDIQPPDQDNNVQCWCSACGAGELHADGMIVPYCWNCGARMDGGADNG